MWSELEVGYSHRAPTRSQSCSAAFSFPPGSMPQPSFHWRSIESNLVGGNAKVCGDLTHLFLNTHCDIHPKKDIRLCHIVHVMCPCCGGLVIKWPRPLLLTWINFNPNMCNFITSVINCGMKVERIRNFIPHFTGHMVAYPCWDLN